ncbi:D-xylose 1-dehydrogenase (NADP(+)) [Lachnellula occidentalis]|uniref:D-xylose 1-dehydrogenase (NADP(+), D-xylono-1,5-lactone-forming) n=1 Tax=Lachnellula occidentalis TaxID=215460 RepID=A0A8H8RU87_9HELO|nr:D-xylose 1-dehydrogenase (NADP(+)) [Lachnellula occidentalis]
MAAAKPYSVRWGILATGGIATTFTKDLLTNPATRSVSDISHIVAAAASSSSASRARDFLSSVRAPSSAKAYGSYHELAHDPDLDIIYIATPHSHHFQNAMLCLEAGKNVLCEKSLTVNAAQARKLVAKAKEKGVFLMEAVWTRYFPLSIKIRALVKDGAIGKVERVFSDLSINAAGDGDELSFSDDSRMVNVDLAGGALLDLGIYSLTWQFQILYLCAEKKEKPRVVAAVQRYRTGADEMTSMVLSWEGNRTVGIATTGLRVATQPHGEGDLGTGPSCRIQGTKGEIQVYGPLYRPVMYKVVKHGDEGGKIEEVDCPIPSDPEREGKDGKGWGHGMFWEADEAARCLRDGKVQSETLTWDESLVIMDVMDEVRRQGGVVYPKEIESDVYDEKSPLNGKS